MQFVSYHEHDGWLVDQRLTALSAQTGYIVPKEYKVHCVGPGNKDRHTIKQ